MAKASIIFKKSNEEMKKILCPIDFSEVANTGLEYAAQLSKSISGCLTLIYVRTTIWPEAVQLEDEKTISTNGISDRLQQICDTIQAEFNISCNYFIEITTHTFEQAIATRAAEYDLIVMGTNGADNYYQYVFGSNTFHVIEKAKCPVLLVPNGFTYEPLKNLVYAYDTETNPFLLVNQLMKLVKLLEMHMRVFHVVVEKQSGETERRMIILRDIMNIRIPQKLKWSFDFQYSDDVPWALDRYMKNHQADILALSSHHHTLIGDLFSNQVVKRMTSLADYPVFVFGE